MKELEILYLIKGIYKMSIENIFLKEKYSKMNMLSINTTVHHTANCNQCETRKTDFKN